MAEMELAGVNLPYSLDAEQSVLGAILLDGNANMPKASAKLHPEHFYVKSPHRYMHCYDADVCGKRQY